MRSPYYFLAKPLNGQRYNSTNNVGGKDIVVSNSIEDSQNTNREALVIETPIGYKGNVEKGDVLIVHHNTFRLMRNQRGQMVNSMKHIKDDIFYFDDYYLRIDKNGKKESRFPYVFMKPIVQDDFVHGKREQDNIGEVVFDNKELNNLGIYNGNRYTFKDFRNTRFNVDGVDYYKMDYKDILTEI